MSNAGAASTVLAARRQFLAVLLGSGLAPLGVGLVTQRFLNPRSPKSTQPSNPFLVDALSLPWRSYRIREDAPETQQALLRRSPDTGVAVVVFFPPGWRTEQLVYYEADEAIFVLDGDFGIGDWTLTTGQYCYLPYRMIRKDIYTRGGALVLAFFNRLAKHLPADPARAGHANQGLEVVDCWRTRWQEAPEVNEGALAGPWHYKELRAQPSSPERTLLISLSPGFALFGKAVAAEPEEFFLLSGNLLVGEQRCRPGAYGYFPGETAVGPACTETGALLLVRSSSQMPLEITGSQEAREQVAHYLATCRYLAPPFS